MSNAIDFHPCSTGDLPDFVQLLICAHHLPIDQRNLQSNWKKRYPEFLERRKKGGLWIDVRAADRWLDQHGKKLLSTDLLADKKRRNPNWVAAEIRLEALINTQLLMIDQLADLVAVKLHQTSTGRGGGK